MKIRNLLLYLLAMILGAILVWFYIQWQAPNNSTSNSSTVGQTNLASMTPSSMESQASVQSESASEPPQPFLNEKINSQATYNKTIIPGSLDANELNRKINEFYEANYSNDEKNASRQKLNDEALTTLQNDLDQASNINALEAKVDQIEVQLGEQTSYVIRLVVPMTQQEANQKVKDSDIELMNQALSFVGNRLVLIAYYDRTQNAVIPVSLSNSSRPALFYYNVQP